MGTIRLGRWHTEKIQKNMLSTHQRLNVKGVGDSGTPHNGVMYSASFGDFLAGVADGEGCFSFSIHKRNIWICTFKISLGAHNERFLFFLRKQLCFGKIYKNSNKSVEDNKDRKSRSEWRIRDRKTLLQVMVPLFHKHKLYSTKHFHFLRWQRALNILEYHPGSSEEKHRLLVKLKTQFPPQGYSSPHWDNSTPSDEWVTGLIEARGSFFLTNKATDTLRVTEKTSRKGTEKVSKKNFVPVVQEASLVHSFGITRELDSRCITFLRSKFALGISKDIPQDKVHKLETTDWHSLERIKAFFHRRLRGIKGLEYSIWVKSFKLRGNGQALLKVQSQMQKITK